jgi:hypothetical protein
MVGFPVKWWQLPGTLHDTKTQETAVRIKIKLCIFRFHRRICSNFFSRNSLLGNFLLLEGSIICFHKTHNEYLGSREKVGTRLQNERFEVRILADSKESFCAKLSEMLWNTP